MRGITYWLRIYAFDNKAMPSVPLLDYAFLAFESDASPKHVAGLQIFELPKHAPPNFVAQLVEKIEKIEPQPPFNKKLAVPLVGMPSWVDADDFDPNYHIVHESVPEPHTLSALLERIEVLHARSLDRSAPLWELYFFEHLNPRRFAVYFKVHHAYMDGISLSQRATAALSEDHRRRSVATFWGSHPEEHDEVRSNIVQDLFGTAKSAGRLAMLVPALTKLGLKHGLRLLNLGGSELPVPFTAPRTAFNTPLTHERSVAVTDLPLRRIQNIAAHAAVTINEVLLELCDRAMIRYLQENGELPEQPLVAQMPVSLHRQDCDRGNQITIALLELGSTETNPVRRLQDIHEHSRNVKQELANMRPETAEAYTFLLQSVAQLGESLGVSGVMPPLGNVVISNFIGPQKRQYLCGAPLLATYPISTIAPGLVLNITIYTYRETLHVGLVAGKDAITDLNPIAEYMQSALDELESAMDLKLTKTRPRKNTQRAKQRRKTARQ